MTMNVPDHVARGETAVFAMVDGDGRVRSYRVYWAPTVHAAIAKGVIGALRRPGPRGLRQAKGPDDYCDCGDPACHWCY